MCHTSVRTVVCWVSSSDVLWGN